MDEKAELVRNWLEKARRDLGMAALVQAEPFLPGLAELAERAADLSPFAADGRYPGDVELTDFDVYAELADTAKTIYRAVLDVLPPEARPEKQL